jgi:two-component system, LuxR family, response regulator FixJ
MSSDSDSPASPPLPLPRHVAVVDDHEGSRRGLAAMIERLGCKCEAYDSIRSFLQAHALRRVDCIVLDVAMPEIDGLTAQKGLRETNYAGPIVFCSGHPEEEIREAAMTNGAAYFLRKPVQKKALVRALECAASAGQG